MGRVTTLAWFVCSALAAEAAAQAPQVPQHPPRIVIAADSDDDDANGVRDGAAAKLRGAAATDVTWLAEPAALLKLPDPRLVRVVPGDRHSSGRAVRGKPGHFGIQGLAAGRTWLDFGATRRELFVIEVLALDGKGERVDLAASHAAITRQLPAFLTGGVEASGADPDSLRWVVVGATEALPNSVELVAERPDGSELDRLAPLALGPIACPHGVSQELACRATDLVRATGDRIDRVHPESAARSLRAEVGGRIVLSIDGRKMASIRVGGPRATGLGPIDRLRGRLRMHVLRSTPGGMPAIGGDDAGAVALARREIDAASGLWGQCGIHFGDPNDAEIFVRDPPPPHLLNLGCELGLPASGGEIRFSVGGRRVRMKTRPGATPVDVAVELANVLQGFGFGAGVSPNPPTGLSAKRTSDVLVRLRDGALARIEPDGSAPLSSDPTLAACLGEVDLADGLSHFSDADASAGTLEERALLKAYADGDPATVDVFVVPSFSGAGRIGESFVDPDGASIRNVVLLDRAGIRAGARSFALAHELGHLLLDMAGHPDDYGVDSPSALMDADATDPSIFGPRRLSVAECERAVRQSGEGAPVPLLTHWPMIHPDP